MCSARSTKWPSRSRTIAIVCGGTRRRPFEGRPAHEQHVRDAVDDRDEHLLVEAIASRDLPPWRALPTRLARAGTARLVLAERHDDAFAGRRATASA